MADEAAPVEAPATEATITPQGDRAWIANAAERLSEAASDDPRFGKAEAEDASEAKPEAKEEPKKAEAKPKVVDANPERAQLEALAKKLGYVLDEDGQVSVKERSEFRESKKRHNERVKAMETDAQARIQQVNTQWASKLERVEKILAAEQADDPDELAKALGHDSWDALQKSRLDRLTDPNFKRIRELEKFKADQEAQRVEAQKQWQAQQETQARQQAYVKHMDDLSASMKLSKDAVCQALHDDPNALQIIFQIQRENYDPDTDSTVTPEQAVKMTPKGGKAAFMEHLKAIHGRLDRIFGAKPAPEQKSATKAAAKPAPKTSPTPNGGPSKTGWAKGQDKDFLRYAREKMDEAAAEEKAAKKKAS